MSRPTYRTGEAELIAELRLQLDRPGVPAQELLAGSLTLLTLGYRALALQYAERAHRSSRGLHARSTREVAAAVLLGAAAETAVA